MTDADVREAIMMATYEALCTRGYTDLTAQDIADRTEKSKSLLFYHYDSKEDLVADFIDYLLDRYVERVERTASLSPVERLAAFVDWFLYNPTDEERTSFHAAMLELRTQARYVEPYRERLRRSDDQFRETLESILRDGMDAGQFVDHDPEETAALLIAAFDGARIRQLTIGRDEYLDQVRAGAVARIIEELLAEGVEFPDEPPDLEAGSFEETIGLEEAEATPEEAEPTPGGGEAIPEDGDATSEDGVETHPGQTDGESSPDDGEPSPDEGEPSPDDGESNSDVTE